MPRFQPGQSGNPGGRPKQDELHVAALAKKHTSAAVEALVKALQSPRERVPAAIALLDRGWGKPVQMIQGDPDRPLAIDFRWADASQPTTIEGQAHEATQLEVTFETKSDGDDDSV